MTHIPPDGVTIQALDTLEPLDLLGMIASDPERATILIDSALKRGTDRRREAWVMQAKLLQMVEKKKLWDYHPAGYRSLAEWLRDPEIDILKSLASEMIGLMDFADEFAKAGYDLIQLILDVGPSKVRKLLPRMRDAAKAECLIEQVGPMLDELRGTDLSGVIDMLNPKGSRLVFDPETFCTINDDGTFDVRFILNYDELEFLAGKLKLRRWFDESAQPIEPPVLAEHVA